MPSIYRFISSAGRVFGPEMQEIQARDKLKTLQHSWSGLDIIAIREEAAVISNTNLLRLMEVQEDAESSRTRQPREGIRVDGHQFMPTLSA
ncbi:hypothetical protein [Paenibacillus alba]|uniref:Uncharacterized protein n=1 Tax=Paenibacillus alba TaxID=1197127 RepID=A0ABU6GAZ3_9BACL|nr:hypothetical protein [Paenibacillus alba]MEC0231311.1 hypothetical protein [Paenibacillus alba]